MINQEQEQASNATSGSAGEIFKNATPKQQEIIKKVLSEERKVIHQKHRTRIFDCIITIIKEHVQ